jgi:hypothetical protein
MAPALDDVTVAEYRARAVPGSGAQDAVALRVVISAARRVRSVEQRIPEQFDRENVADFLAAEALVDIPGDLGALVETSKHELCVRAAGGPRTDHGVEVLLTLTDRPLVLADLVAD